MTKTSTRTTRRSIMCHTFLEPQARPDFNDHDDDDDNNNDNNNINDNIIEDNKEEEEIIIFFKKYQESYLFGTTSSN